MRTRRPTRAGRSASSEASPYAWELVWNRCPQGAGRGRSYRLSPNRAPEVPETARDRRLSRPESELVALEVEVIGAGLVPRLVQSARWSVWGR
jgi:hypothetical protein